MKTFKVPTKTEVSTANQAIFDKLEKGLGFVPNLYAFLANHDNALASYLENAERQSTLSKREKEVINLVVSQVNECNYCLSAHTMLAGLNGFDEAEIIELRGGTATFDDKLNALAKFTKEVINKRGKVSESAKIEFIGAGYNVQNLIDVVFQAGEKIISNYIHNIADFAIDFPLAQTLSEETVIA